MNFKDSIEVTTFLVPIFTLLVVIIYTGITGYQAFIARDTARRQLRAYVGVEDPSFGEKFPSFVNIPVENGGQTPAYGLNAHLNRKWVPAGQGIPKGFDYPDLGAGTGISSVAYLNPGQRRIFTFPIENTELESAQKGEIDLFIYGHVDYVDIYKAQRSSVFSYQYKGLRGADGSVTHKLIFLSKHNDAS